MPAARSRKAAPSDATAQGNGRVIVFNPFSARHPRVGGIRNAAASRLYCRRLRDTGSPAFAGDDSCGCLSRRDVYDLAAAIRPRFALRRHALSSQRAQGKPDARCTRGLVCNEVVETHTSIQVQRRHPTFPAQWLYGLYVLTPVSRALLPPSSARPEPPNLTPASGCQAHTISPYAAGRARLARRGVHRSPPRVRDVRETPLLPGRDAEGYRLIFGF